MIFQFNDGEFSGPIATPLKVWKKINSFIVIIAFSVTLIHKRGNYDPSKSTSWKVLETFLSHLKTLFVVNLLSVLSKRYM